MISLWRDGNSAGMTSICTASSYRAAFREIGDYAAMGLHHYARKHGHAFFEDDASVDLAFSSSLRSVSRSMKSWAAIELVFFGCCTIRK
jgi:hypothetical protein